MTKASLPATYFDKMYRASEDPWDFETSEYEKNKYLATTGALPRAEYENGFEIGCSIGVLTGLLAQKCRRLLSVDASEVPLAKARKRLQDARHVTIKQMQIPADFPDEKFDLVVVSEVGYYWSREDLAIAQKAIADSLLPGGHLLLVHWTPYVADYPLTGDEVHEAFDDLTRPDTRWKHLHHSREEKYRLDLWEG